MPRANRADRLATELLDLAKDMRKAGVIDPALFHEIAARHSHADEAGTATITAGDVRTMREKAHMSQAAFAKHLNVTADYVSQLERGLKQPTGAALVLLDVVRRKGLDAIL